ncbi:MAG: helix-turn-helix transcriptional regulator [Pseudodesulfovibrio sp.]|nr:helix-turn-helix transcriptional regulator [Pseudodesulfovibrio sp.]
MSTFAERLKTVRARHSQVKLAEWLGVSVRSLVHYENGERYPNAEKLELLCRSTGVSPTWLILGEGPMLLASERIEKSPEGRECLRCNQHEIDLREERTVNRELAVENRQLLKENGDLRVDLERMKARAAPDDQAPPEATRDCA